MQVIDEWEPRRLEVDGPDGLTPEEREEEAGRMAREEAETGFDLSRGPLLRVKVLKLEEEEHVVLFTMHHIVSDGWSMGILIREVGALYQAYSAGEESPLEELPIQYADFAVWQREWLQGEVLERQLEYWREQLAGMEDLELPTDHPRPAAPSYRGARHHFVVEGELAEKLRELSRREGVTLFMTLLGGFDVLMSRYSGQEDVVVGTDIANRNRAEIEGLIGFFVNQLVLRVEVRGWREFQRVAEAGEGGVSGGVCASGRAVREAGGGVAAGARPEPVAALPGETDFAERAGRRAGTGRTEAERHGGGEAQTTKFDLTVAITDDGSDLVGVGELQPGPV